MVACRLSVLNQPNRQLIDPHVTALRNYLCRAVA